MREERKEREGPKKDPTPPRDLPREEPPEEEDDSPPEKEPPTRDPPLREPPSKEEKRLTFGMALIGNIIHGGGLMKYSHRIRKYPQSIGLTVTLFWALLAALCWLTSVSCQKEKTTVIKEVPVKEEQPGVEFKVESGKDGGVSVDVKGRVEDK